MQAGKEEAKEFFKNWGGYRQERQEEGNRGGGRGRKSEFFALWLLEGNPPSS